MEEQTRNNIKLKLDEEGPIDLIYPSSFSKGNDKKKIRKELHKRCYEWWFKLEVPTQPIDHETGNKRGKQPSKSF
jgi:hypothetical protein